MKTNFFFCMIRENLPNLLNPWSIPVRVTKSANYREERQTTMLASLAQVEITPPVGIAMTGYIARAGGAIGVHDPLFAKTLVLEEVGQRVALIACDLLGLHLSYVTAVRNAVQAATGIPAANIMLTCSHTHAGPATMFLQDCGEADEWYLAELRQKIVEVISRAVADLRPARFGVGRGQVTAGVHNRRTPGDVIDPELGVLRIEDEAGRMLGVVLNYACHPTCLTGENQLFSAEYPGYAADKLQRVTGAPTMFITGAIGDVGPVARGWPVLEQLGQAVADEALRTLEKLQVAAWNGLSVAAQTVALPLLPPPPTEQLQQEFERWSRPTIDSHSSTLPPHPKIRQAMLHWSEQTLAQVARGQVASTVTTEVQVIRVGDLRLVSAPGELFVELGLAVKRSVDGQPLFLCGFGNDNIGYIPTRRAYPHGGYEIVDAYKYYGYPAALAPAAGEHYVETALQLLSNA